MSSKRSPLRRIVTPRQTLVLTENDREVFFDALMAPPPANERLKRAFDLARRRVRDSSGRSISLTSGIPRRKS